MEYELVAEVQALPCSFIVRGQDRAAYEVAPERSLSAAARAAGVRSASVLSRWGTEQPRPCQAQPLRGVRGATDKTHPDGTPVELGRVTKRLELEAALIALA